MNSYNTNKSQSIYAPDDLGPNQSPNKLQICPKISISVLFVIRCKNDPKNVCSHYQS